MVTSRKIDITRVSRDGSAKKCRNKGARNHDLTKSILTDFQVWENRVHYIRQIIIPSAFVSAHCRDPCSMSRLIQKADERSSSSNAHSEVHGRGLAALSS